MVNFSWSFQIELYNSMVDGDGIDGKVEAMKAYKAACDGDDEIPEHDKVSSALIDKVRFFVPNIS